MPLFTFYRGYKCFKNNDRGLKCMNSLTVIAVSSEFMFHDLKNMERIVI